MLWETVRQMLQHVLKKVVEQTNLPEESCCIAIKGGNEDKMIGSLGWKGGIIDLNRLYCPKYDHQPAIILSMFRQCNMNFHINITENGEILNHNYPWIHKVVVKQVKKNERTEVGYIHCPMSETQYFKYWLHTWCPWLCYWWRSKTTGRQYDMKPQLEIAKRWLAVRRIMTSDKTDIEMEQEAIRQELQLPDDN